MKEFSSFIISFCVVSCVIGGFYIVFPNGKLSKSVKNIAVLSLICSFLGLFCVGLKIEIKSDMNFNAENRQEEMIDVTKMIFEKALKDNKIKYSKIIFITDKNESDSIIISKIVIYSKDDKEKILKIIGNDEEYEVEVINE